MAETDFSGDIARGAKGKTVRLAQEWLAYHGFSTTIDGGFGPATEAVVRAFQERKKLPVNGVVDRQTFDVLLAPVTAVLAPIEPGARSVAQLTVAYARQHLKQHPLEIGGQNSGPWVRLYMTGKEGVEWPWCAGFATFVLRQACRTLGVSMPHPYAFGCDFLAAKGIETGRFQKGGAPSPGYLFLVRKKAGDWAHIGIVESVSPDVFSTIEGNTNDSGSAEGFEVCRRTRAIADKDWLIV